MDLSVIVVNYNVKHFLEQCLHSVMKAMKDISGEIFVVDNNSVDGSCNMVTEKFPDVTLIENRENVGFSKANNQAIRLAEGKYVLLLNPDTVVEEDTFDICLRFMEENKDAGGLGVKMIDGKGHFLPESKRALPTPWVAFYKIFGLSTLFPRSKKFGKYHLGYLNKDQVHEVDVLAGAFMFLRMEVLAKVGLLDEDFFMYGEDIDLSCRITEGGYKNYYTPETAIIHYKGESTKKGSLNYVLAFYRAMIIFAKKHFTGSNARMYKVIIGFAIYLRAFLAICRRLFTRIYKQGLDALIIFLGFFAGLPAWGNLQFSNPDYYPDEFLFYIIPAYIFCWITSIYYSGGYDRPVKLWKVIRGIFTGTFIILVVYALLPDSLRFSRALILLGTGWVLLGTMLLRWILHMAGLDDYRLDTNRKKRIVIAGDKDEADRVVAILNRTPFNPEIIGYVSTESGFSKPYIGSIDQIGEISRINKLDEILFCSASVSSQQIIKTMSRLSGQQVNYKIAPPESLSIIGSNSIYTSGDLYTLQFNSIGRNSNQRSKRLFDFSVSFLLIFTLPVWFLFVIHPLKAWVRITKVFFGLYTFVGFTNTSLNAGEELPKLKRGLLSPAVNVGKEILNDESAFRMNVMYAKDYKVANDLYILLKGFKKIGSDGL